jgi:1-acyl-sn-glycerol-3-phosphate acyltransferase
MVVDSSIVVERRTKGTARALLFTAYVVSLLLVMIPPLWTALLILPRGRLPDRLLRRGARAVLRLSGCRLRVHGLEHLAACGSTVLVATHASYLDSVVLMAAVPIDYVFVVNHRAAAWPFVGRAIRAVGHLVVDRTRHADRRACALAMMDTLRQGRSLLVFPEGTIHRSGSLLPFQPGAFRTAIATGRPVIPITLRGTDDIWSKGAWMLRRGCLDVTVHEPIAPAEKGRHGIRRMSESAREEMAATLNISEVE